MNNSYWPKEGKGVAGRGRVSMIHSRQKKGVCARARSRGLQTVPRRLDSKGHGKLLKGLQQGHNSHSTKSHGIFHWAGST